MVRIFDGSGEAITSHRVDADIPGTVRVTISDSADHREAVDTLLRIAGWIEDEARKAAEGSEFLEENGYMAVYGLA